MNGMREIPIASNQAAVGLKYHFQRAGVAAAPAPAKCSVCDSTLRATNKSGTCFFCKKPSKNGWNEKNGSGKYVAESREPSTMEFTAHVGPLGCIKCKREVTKLVVPQRVPILTTAISCQTCGTVFGYQDEIISISLGAAEKRKENPPRTHVVRGGVALDNDLLSDLDAIRNLVLMGLENGLSVGDVADTCNLTYEYVHAVAVKSGYARKQVA
jgi:hypothetical protein